MRDSGYDYRVYDRYDTGKYANYFRIESMAGLRPGLVLAFEVFEHFPEPARALDEILSAAPALVIFSTVFWEGQGRDWSYLVPICGQHVFFYTRPGLADFAGRHGYELRQCLDLSILVRPDTAYLARLESAGQPPVDAAAAGRMLSELGWGTQATERDHAYAMERFMRELGERRPAGTRGPLTRLRQVIGSLSRQS